MGRITNAFKKAFKRHETERIENALVSAICIIQNEAGMAGIAGRSGHESRLMRWCEELIDESGVDFKKILYRLPDDLSQK